MYLKSVFSSIVLLLFLCSCTDSDRGEPTVVDANLSAALEQATDYAIIAAVEKFTEEANSFSASANTFCAEANASTLTALQEQWRVLFSQWYRLSIYNFGPLDDDLIFPAYTFIDSLRLRGTDYTGTVRSEITADISGDLSLDDDYYALKTFNKVGLLALESVIFETASSEHSQVSENIIAEYQDQSRKCDVLKGLAGQVLARAQYVEFGWLIAHKDSSTPYRTLFINEQLDNGAQPLAQLLVSIQEFLDYLQARNVVTTAAQTSAHSWQAIAATIDEVELLLQGGEQTTDSFFDVMVATGNQNAVDSVNVNLANVRQSITDRNAAMLEINLGNLDGNFKREIADSLNVSLGINFTDGD